jgi:hypothetical protein
MGTNMIPITATTITRMAITDTLRREHAEHIGLVIPFAPALKAPGY